MVVPLVSFSMEEAVLGMPMKIERQAKVNAILVSLFNRDIELVIEMIAR